MRGTAMFNTLCRRSSLRCGPPFLILKSMINFRDWSKERTFYKLNMDFFPIKTQSDRRCKTRNEITKRLYSIPLQKQPQKTPNKTKPRAQKTKMQAAKQKI